VGSERVGESLGIVERGRFETGFQTVWEIVSEVRLSGDVSDSDPPLWGSRRVEGSVLENDVLLVCLEVMGSDSARFPDYLVRTLRECGATDGATPGPIGALTARNAVGITFDNLDVLVRDAESVGEDLGETRLVALAVPGGADEGGDCPRRVKANQAALPETVSRPSLAEQARGTHSA